MSIYLFRMSQAFKYGWLDAKLVSSKHGASRLAIYIDILTCFFRYRLRSVQYVKEDFWKISSAERDEKGLQYKIENKRIDNWTKDCYENRRFLNKWKDYKWQLSGHKYHKRLMAYTKRYNMGTGCIVHYDVELERNHGLFGTITIGNHVSLGKHVYIDYSGDVIIEDGVRLTNGVIIESHHRDLDAYEKGIDVNIPSQIRICKNALIGSRAIVLDSCHYIGKNSRIGAGAVVTKDIPDNVVAAGIPAKVVRYLQDDTLRID